MRKLNSTSISLLSKNVKLYWVLYVNSVLSFLSSVDRKLKPTELITDFKPKKPGPRNAAPLQYVIIFLFGRIGLKILSLFLLKIALLINQLRKLQVASSDVDLDLSVGRWQGHNGWNVCLLMNLNRESCIVTCSYIITFGLMVSV